MLVALAPTQLQPNTRHLNKQTNRQTGRTDRQTDRENRKTGPTDSLFSSSGVTGLVAFGDQIKERTQQKRGEEKREREREEDTHVKHTKQTGEKTA